MISHRLTKSQRFGFSSDERPEPWRRAGAITADPSSSSFSGLPRESTPRCRREGMDARVKPENDENYRAFRLTAATFFIRRRESVRLDCVSSSLSRVLMVRLSAASAVLII